MLMTEYHNPKNIT